MTMPRAGQQTPGLRRREPQTPTDRSVMSFYPTAFFLKNLYVGDRTTLHPKTLSKNDNLKEHFRSRPGFQMQSGALQHRASAAQGQGQVAPLGDTDLTSSCPLASDRAPGQGQPRRPCRLAVKRRAGLAGVLGPPGSDTRYVCASGKR